jgi:hypothetical protein
VDITPQTHPPLIILFYLSLLLVLASFSEQTAMMKFQVIEHTIPCQSIREYHRAGKSDNPALQLAVKQYIPLENITPGPEDVTIIAGHANGIPKVASP